MCSASPFVGPGCAAPGPGPGPGPRSRPLPDPAGGSRSGLLRSPSLGNQLRRSPKTINANFNTVCSLQGGWLPRRHRCARPAGNEQQLPPAALPAPPLRGAPVTGVQVPHTHPSRQARPRLLTPRRSAGRPALRVCTVPPKPPAPRQAAVRPRPAPPAAVPADHPHLHSASTSSRGAIFSASRCTQRRRRRSCCRPHGARRRVGRTRARARASGSAGRRCAAREGGEGPGRPRGEDEAARTRRPSARSCSSRARARALASRRRRGRHRRKSGRARHAHSPPRPPARGFRRHKHPLASLDPRGRGSPGQRSLQPAASSRPVLLYSRSLPQFAGVAAAPLVGLGVG